jgi:hypothetical protein
MGSLTQASGDQRARLMAHVSGLPLLAEEIELGSSDAEETLSREHAFFVEALIPLMETVEARVYPELDRLLSCRLAMTPMEREHAEARDLIARIGGLRHTRGADRDRELAACLRRLHGLVSSHLAEESNYARVLEHNLDHVAADALGSSVQAASAAR